MPCQKRLPGVVHRRLLASQLAALWYLSDPEEYWEVANDVDFQ